MFSKPKKIVETLPSAVKALAEAWSVGKRVMMVDDDSYLWNVVRQIPDSMVCDVEVVGTAGQAKAILASDGGKPFNFVIVDVGVVNGDGIELYAWIKRNFPTLPVLFLTGHKPQEVEAKIREIGSAPIMEKTPKIYALPFWQDLFSTYFKIGWRKPARETK